MSDVDSKLPIADESEISEFNISGHTFGIAIDGTITASAAERALLYISNPNTNTKTMYIASGLLTAAPTQANWVGYNLYYNPVVTVNGTSLPSFNLNAGSSNASVMSLYTIPTVTSNGTLVDSISNVINNAPTGPVFKQIFAPYYILPPGTSMIITGVAKGNNTPVLMILNWFEK